MALQDIAIGALLFAVIVTVPGYFLTLAFFPKRADLDALERLVFSFVFSISFLPLVMLFGNQLLGVPINYFTTLASLLLIIIFAVLVYLVRVQRIPVPNALYRILPKVQQNEAAEILPFLKNRR